MEYKDSKCNAYGTYASDAKLYPALPAVPSAPELIRVEGTAQSYRLQKINEIQKKLPQKETSVLTCLKSITEQ
ncbi:hypothetical protein DPMN_100116 [Dreissena polymorpha]|uniref:Uncharacterized protein n=1 Tax=Dreissena polymorpha TaxID=45954 RepID=A0A9D4R8C9_DREPO|nr:hypothetical protein DPMN_100116 [Dreissena polymorpha]